MKITLSRLNDAYHMEAQNEDGQTLHLDGSPEIGGINGGFRPMQMVLASLAGCSSIDVISILKKMKQEITDFHVEIDGERAEDQTPSVFTKIHLKFILSGNLEEKKVEKAISLSMDKYCSVSKMLENSVEITREYVIR